MEDECDSDLWVYYRNGTSGYICCPVRIVWSERERVGFISSARLCLVKREQEQSWKILQSMTRTKEHLSTRQSTSRHERSMGKQIIIYAPQLFYIVNILQKVMKVISGLEATYIRYIERRS